VTRELLEKGNLGPRTPLGRMLRRRRSCVASTCQVRDTWTDDDGAPGFRRNQTQSECLPDHGVNPMVTRE
jgi:hypothetical protein